MLEAVNISHSFDYELFNDINFKILPNQTVSIIGSSGSGKSTFLHILSSFLKPKKGEVFYNSKSLYDLSEKELIEIRKNDFGVIFQFHYLFSTFSALENIQVASILANQDLDFKLFDRLGISKILDQNIQTLSGGEQQRVSIARVLSKKPKVIFADEPTGNLDIDNANEVVSILKEYCRINEAALIIVTHDLEIAKQFDKVYKLNNKSLEAWSF